MASNYSSNIKDLIQQENINYQDDINYDDNIDANENRLYQDMNLRQHVPIVNQMISSDTRNDNNIQSQLKMTQINNSRNNYSNLENTESFNSYLNNTNKQMVELAHNINKENDRYDDIHTSSQNNSDEENKYTTNNNINDSDLQKYFTNLLQSKDRQIKELIMKSYNNKNESFYEKVLSIQNYKKILTISVLFIILSNKSFESLIKQKLTFLDNRILYNIINVFIFIVLVHVILSM